MKKAILVVFAAIYLMLICSSLAGAQNQVVVQKKFQTKLGKYVNATEAYEMWRKNPGTVKILDCRTAEEYVFVGPPHG